MDILILMNRRMIVLDVLRTIFAHVAGRSLGMMILQQLMPTYAESGFLAECSGGVSINSNLMTGIRSDS